NGFVSCWSKVFIRISGKSQNGLFSEFVGLMPPRFGGLILLTSAATRHGGLPRTGAVSLDGQTARFTRPGLTEEYRVSMDGVRQDFVVLERSSGAGELALWLAVSGARVEPAAGGARLALENSGRKIAYSRLRVTD